MPGTLGDQGPAPQGREPDEPAVLGETAPAPGTSQPSSSEGRSTASSTAAASERRLLDRLLQRKVLTPVALAVIGVILGFTGFKLYSPSVQLPSPNDTTLTFSSSLPMATMTYEVKHLPHSVSEMKLSALLFSSDVPSFGAKTSVAIYLPAGASFHPCPPAFCLKRKGNYVWIQWLKFRQTLGPSLLPGLAAHGTYASANVFVKAHDFGYNLNSVNASATIPKLIYHAPGATDLVTRYDIPSASNYNWTSLRPAYTSDTNAQWIEQVSKGGVIPVVVAVGTDYATQAKDDYKVFLSGIIIGLAGSALLAAVQEALSRRD